MSAIEACAAPTDAGGWHEIPWRRVHRSVRKLQQRIAKAQITIPCAARRARSPMRYVPLEPYEGKPSRTVLRGESRGNTALLPDEKLCQ